VIEPKFSEEQVRKLHQRSGRGFARVIQWIDSQSGANKEALHNAQEEFRGSSE